MPHVGGNTIRGRVAGTWRTADTVWVRDGGAWKVADFVWVRESGTWRVVWAKTQLAAVSPSAALQGDMTVDVSWDAPDPEVCDSYEVRRSNGTLVATVTPNGGPYVVGDSLPLVGTHAYTVRAKLLGATDVDVTTNAVAFGANPQNVTATANTNAGRIELSWDAGDDAVAEIKVYRPDGSLVATLAGSATSVNDESPGGDIDDGTWRVDWFTADGQLYGSNDSTSLDVARKPTSVTTTITSDANETATVTWSAPASNVTGWRINKAIDGDWTFVADVAAGVSSYDYDGPSSEQGQSIQFQVQAIFGLSISDFTNGPIRYFAPNVPTAVTAVATGVIGQLTLTWGAPSTGTYQAYEVQTSENGSSWSASSDDTSPVTQTFSGSSGVRYFRVRSVSHGVTSAWVVESATPTWDTTPPSLPTITSLKPESQYGRLVFRFTITDVTTEAYDFRYRVNDGSWVTVGWAFTSPGSYSLVVRAGSNFSSGDDVDCQIRVRDSLLNESAWSSSWRYKLKAAQQFVAPIDSGHYRQGVWDYLGNTRPYQGYFSNPSFVYIGVLLYGETTIADVCDADGTVGGKLNIQSMKITLARPNEVGDSIENLYMGTVSQWGKFGVPDPQNVAYMGQITRGTSVQYTLTSAQQNALIAGGSGARGIGFERNTTEYLALAGVGTPDFNSLQGFIEINSLG